MATVKQFIARLENETRKADALALLPLMESASGYAPYLSGSMIGFGHYHYKYDSGHEGDSFVTGFAPRKQNLVVYIMPGFSAYQQQLESLGKFTTGKSCLYINKLADIDKAVLKSLVKASVRDMKKKYACRDS